MSKKPGQSKDDILAFLNAKFSKIEQKPAKNRSTSQAQDVKVNELQKKREKKQEGKNQTQISSAADLQILKPQVIQEVRTQIEKDHSKSALKTSELPLISQAIVSISTQSLPVLSEDLLYKQIQNQTQAQKTESINQFKQLQLKSPQIYDDELKNKIFFIGQNALSQPQTVTTMPTSCADQDRGIVASVASIKQHVVNQQRKQMVQKSRHLSKNTLKQLEKMQSLQLSEAPKYETFVKLNNLWKEYISTLLSKDDPSNPNHQASICSKLVKADLTGALIKVFQSKNPTMVGVSGIVTKESVRCLFVINKKNEVKNLIKAGSVFEVILPETHGQSEYAVRIWGDNIIHLGSERTKVRFKEKFALDLY